MAKERSGVQATVDLEKRAMVHVWEETNSYETRRY